MTHKGRKVRKMKTMRLGIILILTMILAGCSKQPNAGVTSAETAHTKVKDVDTLVADVQTHCKSYKPYQEMYGAYCYVVTHKCQPSFEMLCTNHPEYCTPRLNEVFTSTVKCTTLRADGSIYATREPEPMKCNGGICARKMSPEWPPEETWPRHRSD